MRDLSGLYVRCEERLDNSKRMIDGLLAEEIDRHGRCEKAIATLYLILSNDTQ